MASSNAADKPVLDKAMPDGTLVGYGDDVNHVHSADGETQDEWGSAMSTAGLMKVLNQFYAHYGGAETPVLQTATKHWDSVLVSRYYNWQSGPYTGAHVRVASYTLRADAPDGAFDILSGQVVAPLLEKLVTDGTLREYEIDTEAIHTQAPGTFWIVWVASAPEGLNTVNAAIISALKANPLQGPAFGSMVDYSQHRDELLLGEGVYKYPQRFAFPGSVCSRSPGCCSRAGFRAWIDRHHGTAGGFSDGLIALVGFASGTNQVIAFDVKFARTAKVSSSRSSDSLALLLSYPRPDDFA
ncbi:MAG TPA: hypothetical protein VME18_11825 [Acidobacteriaceae bacterium]|nr:hypothetical protein [Acidobacteriaceae bacterium]